MTASKTKQALEAKADKSAKAGPVIYFPTQERIDAAIAVYAEGVVHQLKGEVMMVQARIMLLTEALGTVKVKTSEGTIEVLDVSGSGLNVVAEQIGVLLGCSRSTVIQARGIGEVFGIDAELWGERPVIGGMVSLLSTLRKNPEAKATRSKLKGQTLRKIAKGGASKALCDAATPAKASKKPSKNVAKVTVTIGEPDPKAVAKVIAAAITSGMLAEAVDLLTDIQRAEIDEVMNPAE